MSYLCKLHDRDKYRLQLLLLFPTCTLGVLYKLLDPLLTADLKYSRGFATLKVVESRRNPQQVLTNGAIFSLLVVSRLSWPLPASFLSRSFLQTLNFRICSYPSF